ncbi:hypothetical protein P170DRAFT_497262 [Aspergillus steynii IBT 23096]|uniref:N-acetyltransferase domain-containing protein n=1 Tax=Aspergillus steynii IBT 23096 TaxID=1392250 RepID=A0A2I2G5K3_9EURO|nr:uncharacterized protein P170DRAFT_497262 [Aspergillus steynii IBT 23096]PLB48156.1 hypothetical protein P170DRAFT_497262 [Aspergillus steynii IBT 23096]
MSDTGSDEIMMARGNKFRGPSATPDKAKKEALEELERLRAEIVQKAHLNRFKNLEYDSANPEALVKCRKGPGTDPSSDFYRIMAHRRREGKVATVVEKTTPSSSDSASSETAAAAAAAAAAEEEVTMDPAIAYVIQWEQYIQSPHIYPIVEDGKMHLSQTPTAEHEHIERQMSQTGIDPANAQVDKDMPRPDNKWADAFYADWEYRPRAYSGLEAFRDWFRRWLDSNIQICCYADIYHEAFFDGTAHPDGVRTMYIPNLDDKETGLDKSDEMSMLHAHETAEGYCHNWVLHTRKHEEEQRVQKDLRRQAYIEAMRAPPQSNPNSPKANVYLRPAQFEDSQGILQIMNWYAKNSTLSTDVRNLETGDVRQRIENCEENKLPFIVAVERNTGPIRDNSPENILGYALAKDSVGIETSGRFTAELHVFVKTGFKRQGIGRCLIDKLLEVCDPTYIPKGGYFFKATFDEQPRFGAGGPRRLARLFFAVGYQSERSHEARWLMEWLFDKYDFEEQAILKGARVKFDHFNDVSYLVRTVGYTSNIRFEY